MTTKPNTLPPSPSRRNFLADSGMGFTGLALGSLLAQDDIARGNESEHSAMPTGQAHFAPKAKSVIWYFMLGGTSHMERSRNGAGHVAVATHSGH